MANGYLGDQRIREMESLMRQMCQRKGYDLDTAFKGLLDYLLWLFDPDGQKPDGWRFDADDSEMFRQMSQAWALTMERELKAGQWYDAFGDLYMALHPGGGGKAQFFTPPSVTHVTAHACLAGLDLREAKGTETTFGHRVIISDPAAGSSRMLLAGAVIFRQMQHDQLGYDAIKQSAYRPYLVAEDLDYNCVKMSAINMAIHGCFGECVCHDSLCEPGEVWLGYIVNEMMWPFPTDIPSIRRYTDPPPVRQHPTMAAASHTARTAAAETRTETNPTTPTTIPMVTISDTPQSANLREYCGWSGNTEDDIVTTGTIYHDTASNGLRNGKRVFKNCYRAEITISGQRYRHRAKDREDCVQWLKAVRMGKIKPTDNKADWWRMEQRKDDIARIDEIIVSAAEESVMLYDYHQTGDLSAINDYLEKRLLPHMAYYCAHTLRFGRDRTITASRQAAALLLTRITAGKPVMNFTATCKRMLRVHKQRGNFFYYENAPEPVKLMVNGMNLDGLAEVWKVTKDRRI